MISGPGHVKATFVPADIVVSKSEEEISAGAAHFEDLRGREERSPSARKDGAVQLHREAGIQTKHRLIRLAEADAANRSDASPAGGQWAAEELGEPLGNYNGVDYFENRFDSSPSSGATYLGIERLVDGGRGTLVARF